jgi:hypothetical protein
MTTERVAAELAHLIRLAETNTAFAEYASWKAQAMALKDPLTWNELPVLLSNSVNSRKSGPPRPSSKPRSKHD